MRAILAFAFALGLSSQALADEVVGSISGALFGYAGHTEPGGVYFGFTACPGGPGTNLFCNTSNGPSPPYTLGSIGFVPSSSVSQVFMVDHQTDSTFGAVAQAMQSTPFNENFAFNFGDVGSSFTPASSSSSGGPSDFINGYWDGSTINSVRVTVHAFDFIPVDLGPNGGIFYAIRNLDGFGAPAGSNIVTVELDFYGVRGAYQGPPSGVPEPATWAAMVLGFAMLGDACRRRDRRRPAARVLMLYRQLNRQASKDVGDDRDFGLPTMQPFSGS